MHHRMLSHFLMSAVPRGDFHGARLCRDSPFAAVPTPPVPLLFHLLLEALRTFRFSGMSAPAISVSLQVISRDSVTKATPAIETRPPAPAIIKSHKAWIGVAGAVVTARIEHWSRVPHGHMAWAPTLQSPPVKILLRDGQEGLLTLCRVNPDRID